MGLLVLLLLCHWAGDYTHLSRPWMLEAKRFGKPILPILNHGCVHGFLMLWTMYFFGVPGIIAAILATFQVLTHTGIDVLKGRLNGWFPSLQNPANIYHWWVFGLDQFLHILVILTMWIGTLPFILLF